MVGARDFNATCAIPRSQTGQCRHQQHFHHPRLKRSSASAAAKAISAEASQNASKAPAATARGRQKNNARLRITPTTAAVIAVSGAVNFSSPWVDSPAARRQDEQKGR